MKTTKISSHGRHPVNKPAAGSPPEPPASDLLDMDEAIAVLKTTRSSFYRWLRSGKIKGLKFGRKWRFKRDDIERFMAGETPQIQLTGNITPLIDTLREKLAGAGGTDSTDADGSPVLRAVMLMVLLAQKMRATDFSIEPGHKQASLRFSLDGVLQPVAHFDVRLLPAVVDQLKMLSSCSVQEKVIPQDGRIVWDPPQMPERIDVRVCFLPAVGGESVTARLIFPSNIVAQFDISKLGFSLQDELRLSAALGKPSGLIIITSPTGTGKTTTLYSCLQRLVGSERKIITIEDPVECTFDGLTQMQIRPHAGLTFAAAIRATLRSTPNVIFVGEIRDGETATLCIQAALTGLMVLTVLHTNDAVGAIKRLLDVSPVTSTVMADAISLVGAQRLVRRLCPHCSQSQSEPPLLDQAMAIAQRGGLDWQTLTPQFRSVTGCLKCNMTGYLGRILLGETLAVTLEIASAIRGGATVDELRATAIRHGMTTMVADGIRKAAAGLTTIEEVLRVLPQDDAGS